MSSRFTARRAAYWAARIRSLISRSSAPYESGGRVLRVFVKDMWISHAVLRCFSTSAVTRCSLPICHRISSLVQSQVVIHRLLQILPRSQVALGSLDGCVAQQELNLLEVPTGFAAELGAGPPHIMGGKLIDESGLPRVLGHD